jgi:hypothetical protein
MREQLSRFDGIMRGVPDLTWGYASLLTARWSQEKLYVKRNIEALSLYKAHP